MVEPKQKNKIKLSSRPILVSVLLPVYNGSAYIKESVQSVLRQTYDNFELIIINDGSTDESASIIKKIKDSRIRFYEQANKGLAAALNRAIRLSRGKYLARHDQDDLSLPQRFEKQVAFLESHPEYGMVGTWTEIWKGRKKTQRISRHPTDSLILKFELLFDSHFIHSSVMIRKEVFDKVGLYSTDKSRQPPEDYELWSRIVREFEVANIPEVLQIYREIPGSMSRVGSRPFLDKVINLSVENLAWITGKSKQNKSINDLVALAHKAYHKFSSNPNFSEIRRLLYKAADKLSDSFGAPRAILRKKARLRFQSIKSFYLEHRYGKILGKIILFLDKIKRVD